MRSLDKLRAAFHTDSMDRVGLADFLRRRREALKPGDVGLSAGARRRTLGLRREEVAQLAHMSTDFYARLEQARGSRPSAQTTAALSRALRLTPAERDHLYELSGHVAPPRAYRTDHASPGLARVLHSLNTPAQIVSDLGVILDRNALGQILLGDHTPFSGLRRSIIYRWFVDPAERRIFAEEEHDQHARAYVAMLRAAHGRSGDDPEVRELVDRLLMESEEFADLWALHEVSSRQGTLKCIVHPLVGRITLDCQMLSSENVTERLIVFTAVAGSEDAKRLELLSVVGGQAFSGGR
jgi:transcriptional regulator with XRE-family HTH domain